jgi:KAP family P-loop domain
MVWYVLAVTAFLAWLLWLFFPFMWPSAVAQAIQKSKFGWRDWCEIWFCLLALALLLNLRWGWLSYRRSGSQGAHKNSILSDAPIRESSEDEFNRGELADLLAAQLLLPPGSNSIVIGIEGAWGCGKSSLLALVEQRLLKMSPSPVIVHFNPWVLGTVAELADIFFKQIAEECASQGAAPALVIAFDGIRRDIERDRISGTVRFLIQIFEFISRIVMAPRQGRDLLARKEGVSQLLDRLGRSVVVLVDDVDRLTPEQIRAVFQLIRAVGDFNRMSYVVAYDPIPVESALEFGNSLGFGRAYKDKIVQLKVNFPRQPGEERKSYLRAIWRAAEDRWNISVPSNEKEATEEAFSIAIKSLTTPRQVKVVVNETFFQAQSLKNEIALSDLLVFAVLGNRFSSIVAAIRRLPSRVLRGAGLDLDGTAVNPFVRLRTSPDGEEEQDALEALVKESVPGELDQAGALELLRFLFPTRPDTGLSASRRLQDRNNLWLMLFGGARGAIFSNAECEKLLYDLRERESLLDDHERGETLAPFLDFARGRIDRSRAVPELGQFFESLVRRAREIFAETRLDFSTPVSQLADAILRLSGTLPNEKWRATQQMVLNGKYLSPGHELMVRLFSYVGAWRNGRWIQSDRQLKGESLDWLSDENVESLRRAWLDVVRGVPLDLLMRREPGAIGILHRWGQLQGDGYHEVQLKLLKWLEESPSNLVLFSEEFPPGISFAGTDALVPLEFGLVQRFRDAGVSERQIERLLEDCPQFGRTSDIPS